MATTEQTSTQFRPFSSGELANIIKVTRAARGWSQDTLSALSGLTVRTIQRVENAEPSSPETRRALARAFGLDDLDAFVKAHEFPSAEKIAEQAAAFERDYMLLDVSVAASGKELADLAEASSGYIYQPLDENAGAAASHVAALFDWLKEYGDCDDLYSLSEKVGLYESLSELLNKIDGAGYRICYALRAASLVGNNWVDKTPWRITVGYAFAAPKNNVPTKFAVRKSLQ